MVSLRISFFNINFHFTSSSSLSLTNLPLFRISQNLPLRRGAEFYAG